MAADFKTRYLLRTLSVIIQDDCLVVLETDGGRDRVRRIYFDQVQSLSVWKTMPWLLPLLGVLVSLFGLLLLLVPDSTATTFAVIILAISIVFVALPLYWKRTRIRVIRAGTAHQFHFFVRPGKAQRIVEKIRTNIERCHADGYARLAESTMPGSPDSVYETESSTSVPPPIPGT